MIALASDCLLFEMSGGESVPFSAEMISVELMGETASLFDEEFVRHASHAVFHYFKHELGRQSVSVSEFAGALEKVLRGFVLSMKPEAPEAPGPEILESDLRRLANESGKGCELFFFPRLREELQSHVQQSPRMVRFKGLRGCVKQLVGAQRWTPKCRTLEEQIVDFMRGCLSTQAGPRQMALLVE